MALPAALQREQEAAEAAMKAIQGVTPPPVVTDPSQVAVVPPPAAPTPPPQPPKAPDVPPSQPTQAPAPADDGFKAKYLALQGKYNAEVPRMHQQIAELTRRMEQLTAAPPQPPAPPPEKPAVTPKEVEDFGAPMTEFVQRMAQATFAHAAQAVLAQIQSLDVRIKAIEHTVNGVTQQAGQTREELFFAELTRQVPNWERINVSADWLEWLDVKDGIYGLTRQQALQHARETLDVQRAISIFKAFEATKAPPPPPAAPPAAPPPPNPLESLVAPSAGAATPPAPPAQPKPIYSKQFLNRFYREVEQGMWRGREAEVQAIEADIALAAAEGRIR